LKRGEIWTVTGAKDYAGKPRPAVILQDDRFDATESITICVMTTDPAEAPLFRVPIAPNEQYIYGTAHKWTQYTAASVHKQQYISSST
jgi:mRNA-degrading endonuclease toxin of MazEF toxin-antitoxin module